MLNTPLDEAAVRTLRVGDVVLLSGRVYTGRDAVHAHLVKHEAPVDLRGAVIYDCGPVVVREGDGWRATATGPTTSMREEPYQAEILRTYGIRAVIGKGGMGSRTLDALREVGAVYLKCDRRACAVLHPMHRGRRGCLPDRVWNAGSHVAPTGTGLSRDRHDGRARQQPPS